MMEKAVRDYLDRNLDEVLYYEVLGLKQCPCLVDGVEPPCCMHPNGGSGGDCRPGTERCYLMRVADRLVELVARCAAANVHPFITSRITLTSDIITTPVVTAQFSK